MSGPRDFCEMDNDGIHTESWYEGGICHSCGEEAPAYDGDYDHWIEPDYDDNDDYVEYDD